MIWEHFNGVICVSVFYSILFVEWILYIIYECIILFFFSFAVMCHSMSNCISWLFNKRFHFIHVYLWFIIRTIFPFLFSFHDMNVVMSLRLVFIKYIFIFLFCHFVRIHLSGMIGREFIYKQINAISLNLVGIRIRVTDFWYRCWNSFLLFFWRFFFHISCR